MVIPIFNVWQGAGLVLVVMGGLLVVLRRIQRSFDPDPELVRKLFHIGMGLFTLTLPWLFAQTWPVAALTGVTLALMIALRRCPGLRERFGGVLGCVGRHSLGEFYFPLSVALLFYLTRDNLALYLIPLLILTLADSTAALIGVRYGTLKYQGVAGHKSAEGSAAFFMVTFLCVYIPLLFTQVGRTESLLIAVIMGLLVMLCEAIAWRGLDNLLIPLAAYLLLLRYVEMTADQLLARLLFTLLLAGAVFLCRRRTTLNDNALLGTILVGYLCWWLGGWEWIIPPAILLLHCMLFVSSQKRSPRRVHDVQDVFSVCAAGLLWLGLASVFRRASFLLPYTAAFATHFAMAGIARLKGDHSRLRVSRLLLTGTGKAWLLFTLVFFASGASQPGTRTDLLTGLAGIATAALAFYAVQSKIKDSAHSGAKWWRQACAVMPGSLLTAVTLFTR